MNTCILLNRITQASLRSRLAGAVAHLPFTLVYAPACVCCGGTGHHRVTFDIRHYGARDCTTCDGAGEIMRQAGRRVAVAS